MKFWEFLLQKEGDRSWLPLESPDVEILEGRYRVVARSSLVKTPVEVCITHQVWDEVSPRRRVQKRTGRTNADGLLVVIPFTRLQPGIWELRCTSDLMADMMGDSWQYFVQLQVLSQDSETAEDWEPDWQPAIDEEPQESAAMAGSSSAISLETGSETPSEELIASSPVGQDSDEQDSDEQNFDEQNSDEELVALLTAEHVPDDAPASPSPAAEQIDQTSETMANPAATPLLPILESVSPEPASLESASPELVSLEPLQVEAELVEAAESHDSVELGSPPPENTSGNTPVFPPEAVPDTALIEPDLEPASLPELSITAQSSDLLQMATEVSDLFQIAENISEQVVESLFKQFDRETDSSQATSQTNPASHPSGTTLRDSAPASPAFKIALEKETYTVQRGQVLSLHGQIEALSGDEAHTGAIAPTKIQVRLQDPQSGEVLAQVQQEVAPLPFSFACDIPVPAISQTHLLLGEVALLGHAEGENIPVLAVQSFSITADVNDLLEAIANDFTESEAVQPPLTAVATASTTHSHSNLNLTFLNLASNPAPPALFQTSTQPALPPQLHPPNPAQPVAKPLQLPLIKTAVAPQSESLTSESLTSEPPVNEIGDSVNVDPVDVDSIDSVDVDLEQVSTQLTDDLDAVTDTLLLTQSIAAEVEPKVSAVEDEQIEPPPLAPTPPDAGLTEPEVASPEGRAELAALPPAKEPSPEEQAFQALKLQERFWSRLNSLMGDLQFSNELWESTLPEGESPSLELPGVESSGLIEAAPSSAIEKAAPASSDLDLVAQEVVVDDEEGSAGQSGRQGRSPLDPPEGLVLPEDEPVPTPQLELQTGELTAGKPVNVFVKLPSLRPRIYVKLWVHDRQTRSLLDGPRWLIDFSPNGLGDLETSTQLTVPFGCFEIQFEAIAVEITTQRESHKVSVHRVVVPPDLPSFSSDNWEI